MKKDKLRLLVTTKCPRSCEGCCNKDWDFSKLPVAESFKDYKEILITGGEPGLHKFHYEIQDLAISIRKENPSAKIYMYTAESSHSILYLLGNNIIDGITLTLHSQEDVSPFLLFDGLVSILESLQVIEHNRHLSLRLNVFEGIEIPYNDLGASWIVKKDMVWIKNCPVPEDEDFKRLNNLW